MNAIFIDYYLSELKALGIEANSEGTPIEELDKDDLQQLLAVEQYKITEGSK